MRDSGPLVTPSKYRLPQDAAFAAVQGLSNRVSLSLPRHFLLKALNLRGSSDSLLEYQGDFKCTMNRSSESAYWMLCLLLSAIDGHVAPFTEPNMCSKKSPHQLWGFAQLEKLFGWGLGGVKCELEGVSLSTPSTCSFPFSDFTHQRMGKMLVPHCLSLSSHAHFRKFSVRGLPGVLFPWSIEPWYLRVRGLVLAVPIWSEPPGSTSNQLTHRPRSLSLLNQMAIVLTSYWGSECQFQACPHI